MEKPGPFRRTFILLLISWLAIPQAEADGGYFSPTISRAAISTDQRAIIIKNRDQISMTLSSAYTGDGGAFGWIIPTPVPPNTWDVTEAGTNGERAFEILDGYTAPQFTTTGSRGGGCFPAGTDVLTANGPRPIEKVDPGTRVYACNLASGEWILAKVLKRQSFRYQGDMVIVRLGSVSVQATGNHPFYVLRGDRLASRPLPRDVSREEQDATREGRWVEARDLREGDLLKSIGGEGLSITGVSSRSEKAEVFCLEVERYHNCAVHRAGILVHNAGKMESKAATSPETIRAVKVYGKVTLAHYEVSIVGAADASALLGWLQDNEYQANPEAREVLDTYIDQRWAFVVVKLTPKEKRPHSNEFLPPLTITYPHDQLIFPLRISSVSTLRGARISLYVIAESTVTSSNFPAAPLKFESYLSDPVNPEDYIEASIQRTLASEGRGLVVMWSGALDQKSKQMQSIEELMKTPFQSEHVTYLTRLDARMDPAAMTKDIAFVLDPEPKSFQVRVAARGGLKESAAPIAGVSGGPGDTRAMTALMFAASSSKDLEMISRLLKAGAEVNERNAGGWTALMYAAKDNQSPDVISALLKAGADVNAQDSQRCTALMHAAKSNENPEVTAALLGAGADVEATDKNGWTALMHAATSSRSREVVALLLKAGSEVDARIVDGWTALMFAARSNQNPDVIAALLQGGAAVNARGNNDWTALMFAARSNQNPDVISVLLKAGADVNARNADNRTALMFAAEYSQNPEVIWVLLKAGADVTARSNEGKTAFDYARETLKGTDAYQGLRDPNR